MRPAARLPAGSVVMCGDITVTVLSHPDQGVATVGVAAAGELESAIEAHGTMPLPPYFKGTLDDPGRYQTIFAETLGSAAAPTAALHFTPSVLAALDRRGIDLAKVELEVGLDTFRPMTGDHIDDHRIHTERVTVPGSAVEAVRRARERDSNVIAVGTTVARALESAAVGMGRIEAVDRPTSLFIKPGYTPQVIDGLITNFHAPRTTLLVLLAALMGDEWRTTYSHALENGYRFLSFGDAMYVEVQR